MKPYVICHSMSSVDGRIQSTNWGMKNAGQAFEKPAATIKVDAWIVGRTTMQEFASKKPHPIRSGGPRIAKDDYVAPHSAKTYAVAIDPSGKCRWDGGMVDTEHVIEVLTEKVSSAYLFHLREKGVSYLFAGKKELDLARALEKLNKHFGIRRVRIDGGGGVNGSFLRAGLIDELSHVVVPVADGAMETPAVFDVEPGHTHRMAKKLKLKSVKRLPGGILWVRYKVKN